MQSASNTTPRGGDFARFEVRDGIRRVVCIVAEEALEAASGLTAPSTNASRRKSFDRYRSLIDAAAKLKLKTMEPGFDGPLVLSSADLRRVPPEVGVPSFGSAPRDHYPVKATASR